MSSTEGKVIKCKAAVLAGSNQTFSIEIVDVAPPKEKEVRIKVEASGVCQTDASARAGQYHPFLLGPIILGHEGAGIVESVGPGVTSVKPGDHVVMLYVPYCGNCRICKEMTDANFCEGEEIGTMGNSVMSADGKSRFTKDGKDIYHFLMTSTFVQYTVIRESCVAKVNPQAPLDKICLLGCGIPAGYGAAVNGGKGKIDSNSSCVVFGLGGVGLAAVMGCKNSGAKKIVGVDVNPSKFDLAKKMGCTDVINPKDHEKPIDQVILEMTNGGVDCAIECAGTIPTMQSAIGCTHKAYGRTVLTGFDRLTVSLSLSYLDLIRGRELTGRIFGGFKGRKDIPTMVEEYLQGKIKIDELITHNLPLEKINDAFDLLRDGKCVRVVLKMWE